MTNASLPLSEHRPSRRPIDPEREAEIARLVEHFYINGRRDPLLGPVFESGVDDWDAHFRTMNDFWTSAIYRTGRYAGRPIEAHRDLEGLSPAHFDRWLALWTESVDAIVASDAADELKRLAGMMAATMQSRLGLERDGESD